MDDDIYSIPLETISNGDKSEKLQQATYKITRQYKDDIKHAIKSDKSKSTRKYHKERRQRLQADKVCWRCNQPNKSNKSICDECAEYENKQSQSRRQTRRELSLCIKCGKRVEKPNRAKCDSCRRKTRDYVAQRRANAKITAQNAK